LLSGPKITFLMSKESSVSLVFNKKRTNAFGVLSQPWKF